MVLPGAYTAKLTVSGQTYTQPIMVVQDPRVSAAPAALTAQFELQQRMVAGLTVTYNAFTFIQQLRSTLGTRLNEAAGKPEAAQITSAIQTLDAALAPIANSAGPNAPPSLGSAHRDLGRRINDQLIGDLQPTANIVAGVDAPCQAIDAALESLRKLQTTNIRDLNTMLTRANLGALPAWTPPAAPACGK